MQSTIFIFCPFEYKCHNNNNEKETDSDTDRPTANRQPDIVIKHEVIILCSVSHIFKKQKKKKKKN